MSKSNATYISSLDLLRGLAALAVCIFHLGGGNHYLPETNFLEVGRKYGRLGVEVFFVISGFIIPFSMQKGNYSYEKIRVFFLKRFARIEPPYVVSIVLVLGLNFLSTLSPLYRGEPFNINSAELFSHLGYLTDIFGYTWVNIVYWTLAIEFQYYILIALIFPFLASEKMYVWATTLLFFNLAAIAWPNKNFIFAFAPYFTLGILNYKYLFKHYTSKIFYTLSAGVLIFIFFNQGTSFLIAAILPLLFINFLHIENSVSRFMGNISFSLYLIHVPIGGRIINLSTNFVQDEYVRVCVVVLAILICILFAYFFYRVIEKPSMALSKLVTYKKKKKILPLPVYE